MRPRTSIVGGLGSAVAELYTGPVPSERKIAQRWPGVGRWTVGQRLRERGIQPLSAVEASDLARFLAPPLPPTCAWPACTGHRQHGGLCEQHAPALDAHGCGRCMWPNCEQYPISDDALCSWHRKLATGLTA